MNNQRLNEIYQDPSIIHLSEVEDIRQLAKDYPYFSKPFEILAKYYFQTNHYRFEEMLRQAAMRVRDRKTLYEYIHTEQILPKEDKENSLSQPVEIEVQAENTDSFAKELTDEESSVEAFLSIDEPQSISSSESVLADNLDEEAIEVPFEFEGNFKQHETVQIPEEQDIIGEEIATEFSFSKAFSITDQSENSEDISIETEAIAIEELNESFEMDNEFLIEEEAENNPSESELAVDNEAELIIETTESKQAIPDLELRKYPVYSVETFIQHDEKEEKIDSSKDFFAWLNNPQKAENDQEIEEIESRTETIISEEKPNKTLDLIEKFITINPQISRPKKEFYSPENMAKKSEVLDLEFVSETLAELYYQQGNFDNAIRVYEKLSLQNPSKASFFADLIDQIKKERK